MSCASDVRDLAHGAAEYFPGESVSGFFVRGAGYIAKGYETILGKSASSEAFYKTVTFDSFCYEIGRGSCEGGEAEDGK